MINNNQLIQLGGFGEITDFGHNYRQGDRVYSSEGLAATLSAQPLGNRGGTVHCTVFQTHNTRYRGIDMLNNVKILGHIGVGGQKGYIYIAFLVAFVVSRHLSGKIHAKL